MTKVELAEKGRYVELETGGYWTTEASTPTTAANSSATDGNGLQITYDKVFLLSQPEFLEYVGLSDERASTSGATSGYYWLRSAYSSATVRPVAYTGTSFRNYISTNYSGVRPALWVAL